MGHFDTDYWATLTPKGVMPFGPGTGNLKNHQNIYRKQNNTKQYLQILNINNNICGFLLSDAQVIFKTNLPERYLGLYLWIMRPTRFT